MISFSESSANDHLVMLTKNGLVKRTPMQAFANARGSLAAIKLRVCPQYHTFPVKPSLHEHHMRCCVPPLCHCSIALRPLKPSYGLVLKKIVGTALTARMFTSHILRKTGKKCDGFAGLREIERECLVCGFSLEMSWCGWPDALMGIPCCWLPRME